MLLQYPLRVSLIGYNVDMLLRLPLTSGEDIVAEYRPGQEVTARAVLRTLKSKGFLSQGLTVSRRDEGGQWGGKITLYCALNRDAARLARAKEEAEAQAIAKRAAAIERLRSTKKLAQVFASRGGGKTHLAQVLAQAVHEDQSTRQALNEVVSKIALAGSRQAAEHVIPSFLGKVVKLHGGLADVELKPEGEHVTFARDVLAAQNLAFIGAAIAFRWEELGPGLTMVAAEPALEVDPEVDSDFGEHYPFRRPLGETRDLSLAKALLAAPPTLTRPSGVTIED